ncbi:MAG: hypothetical protein IT383_14035 [Deltaproteobacteria bacterium]|nr:hypothetical protein [Deltaproteobacteria bacterium]
MLPLTLAALAVALVPEPIAVAPWRNLNAAPELDWLSQGAAETMAADLRGTGMRVVERAAIAQALAELERKVTADDEVARAVLAGRLVGAKSLVLGSFQAAGGELRLVARFVDVETGVVAETAKATGPLDTVFALQDRIVGALAARAGRKAAPPARKRGAAAYQRFAASLAEPDDAKRRAMLEDALRVDPSFSYALAALDELEARLRMGRAQSAAAFAAREVELLAIVEDAKADASRRRAAATALLQGLEGARRFHALLTAAERVLAAQLPRDVLLDLDEQAAAARVIALARLLRVDEALQAGERHLAAFPTGARRAEVERVVRALVEERRSEGERRRDFDEELRELAADRAEAEREGRAAEQRLSFDFKPCIAAKWSRLPDEMTARCTSFLAAHRNDLGKDAREHVRSARAYVAWGHALRGRFAEARRLADELERDDPGSLDESGLRSVMAAWSTD